MNAVIEKTQLGTSFGMPTQIETEIAKLAVSMVPNVDKIRFVNSGTEACMSAVRLARGFTGKDKIIKFAGCYHGHSDSFLIQAGSGAVTFGSPNSPGVTQGTGFNVSIATLVRTKALELTQTGNMIIGESSSGQVTIQPDGVVTATSYSISAAGVFNGTGVTSTGPISGSNATFTGTGNFTGLLTASGGISSTTNDSTINKLKSTK